MRVAADEPGVQPTPARTSKSLLPAEFGHAAKLHAKRVRGGSAAAWKSDFQVRAGQGALAQFRERGCLAARGRARPLRRGVCAVTSTCTPTKLMSLPRRRRQG